MTCTRADSVQVAHLLFECLLAHGLTRLACQDTAQNFAVCLEGTADAQPGDHFQAFLQQPCSDCQDVECWGVLQVCSLGLV